jgi:hypothetical protein
LTEVSSGKVAEHDSFVPKTNFFAQQTSLEVLLPKVTSITLELTMGKSACIFIQNYNKLGVVS